MNSNNFISLDDAAIQNDLDKSVLIRRCKRLGIKISRSGMLYYIHKESLVFLKNYNEIKVRKKALYNSSIVEYFNKNSNKTIPVIASELQITPGMLTYHIELHAKEIKESLVDEFLFFESKMNDPDFDLIE